MPSPSVLAPGHVVFAIDTSGSMDAEELAAVLAEVRSYRETFPCRLTVIQADAAVQSVQSYGELDGVEVPRGMAVLGRGGTDFRPVFEWIREKAEETPTVLIYATDGFGTFPNDPRDSPGNSMPVRAPKPKSEIVPCSSSGFSERVALTMPMLLDLARISRSQSEP